MKFTRLALAVAMAVGLASVPALAQAQSGLVQPVAYESNEYYAADDGAKAPAAPPAAAPAAPAAPADASCAGNAACGCESCGCCDSCGCGLRGLLFDDCKLDCPDLKTCRLFDDCCWLKCHDITVTGWLEAGSTFRDGARGDSFNGPDGFNDRDQEFQGNQLYTTIQKALKDNDCCWDWGFTVDTLVGSDYRYPVELGFTAHDNGVPRWNLDPRHFYGVTIPQAYVEGGWSDLSFKLGETVTLLANETINPTANFFYSHNYCFLYAVNFTQTGILATQKLNDQVVINYGVNNGWDTFNDQNENPSATGGFTWTSCDKRKTLAWFFLDGNEPETAFSTFGPFANRFVSTAVFTDKLSDRLTYTCEGVVGEQTDGAGPGRDASWYGSTSYLTYQLNCCWTEGIRLEWFRDTEGTRVAPPGDFAGGNTASQGGFAGNFYDITYGLNYKMNGNLTIRPEVRYDLYNGSNGNAGGKPYLSGTADHQWLFSCDAIWLF